MIALQIDDRETIQLRPVFHPRARTTIITVYLRTRLEYSGAVNIMPTGLIPSMSPDDAAPGIVKQRLRQLPSKDSSAILTGIMQAVLQQASAYMCLISCAIAKRLEGPRLS
jgi:hypothetical protein